MYKIALAGNPNSGKTTLFNVLTGSTAHVGNWPGVTVDKKEGVYKKLSEPVSIIDLPGIYSLSPYTPEEVIARKYVLEEKPDCVINIVDVTNLERNLYLTTQIMETDVPVIVALNMMDQLEKTGDKVDVELLQEKLKVPVVKISALKSKGLAELMQKAYELVKGNGQKARTVLENYEIYPFVKELEQELESKKISNATFKAVKLVEEDEIVSKEHPDLAKKVLEYKKTFKPFNGDTEAYVADAKYKFITKDVEKILERKTKDTPSKSDKIDKVLTHKIWSIPIFAVILFALFHLTFSEDLLYLGSIFNLPTLSDLGLMTDDGPINVGVAFLSCIYDGGIKSPGYVLFYLMEYFTGTVTGWIELGLTSISTPTWAMGLLVDGVLSGLSSVLSFVPQIVFLLLLLSILEDTGYMARVAFILDKMFRRFGISGRALIPMIMGFGCSIPAMTNTRTLQDEREKTMTIRTIPFFSCGAKLPILVAVSAAVAHMVGLGDGGIISFSMYIIGILVAIVSIILMRSTTQKGEVTPFIMELPAYHLPKFSSLMVHLWEKIKHYLERVFTIILASTIVIWFLSNFGWNWKMVTDIETSMLASIGQLIQPLFTPLGFGVQLNSFGWVFAVAAITGLIAKEEVVATFGALSVLFASTVTAPELAAEGGTDVMIMALGTGITWQALVAFIVFNLTTIPCFAAVATAKGETAEGKFKWTLIFWIVASFIASSIVYVVLSWWWTTFIVVAIATLLFGILYIKNKKEKVKW